MTEPVVFLGYSEQDEIEKDALLSRLAVLASGGLIDLWSEDRIGTGADWEAEFHAALTRAKVAILLISPDFLTSEFIVGQLVPSLLQRRQHEGLVVFPVITRACAWHTVDWLAQLKIRPKDRQAIWHGDASRVNRELATIADEVAALVSDSQYPSGQDLSEQSQAHIEPVTGSRGGEAHISNISGGDIDVGHLVTGTVGGDVISGDKVAGDKVAGNKIIHYHLEVGPVEAKPKPETPLQPYEPVTILIPAGPFLMGSEAGADNEAPQHELVLPAYRIGKYPITNREYAEFIKQQTHYEPPEKPNWPLREPPKGKLDHPVVGVSWLDAVVYCHWLSDVTGRRYRLPTEAEWEKAASWTGQQKRRHPWGDEFDARKCNSQEAGLNDTTAVGRYSPQGDSRYGGADMIGNVQEWTSTLWGSSEQENPFPYPYQANDGREDATADHLHYVLRIYRGSSFRDNRSKSRCTLRRYSSYKGSSRWRGFRVVLEV